MSSAAPTTNRDVGRTLRRARQRHHVELEDAASETRIPKRYLEALEDNAPLDTYPAPMYARAFLREYAKYLGVDAEPLVGAFGSAAPEDIHLHTIPEALPAPRRWPSRLLLAMSIGGLVALAVLGILSGREEPGLSSLGGPGPVASSLSPPGKHHHKALPPVTGIKAVLRFVDRCWVQARGDGQALVTRTFEPEQIHVLKADRTLELTLGNAGAVQLILNGKRTTTGDLGEVLHLSVVLRHGRLHVNRV
jgi:cytoskeleton protein RodZ